MGQQARALSLQQKCRMLNRCVQPILNFGTAGGPGPLPLLMPRTDSKGACFPNSCQPNAGLARPWKTIVGGGCKPYQILLINRAIGAHNTRVEFAIGPNIFNDHEISIPLQHYDVAWLEERRLSPHVGRVLRPGTRSSSGFLHVRWDESLAEARTNLPQNQSA